MAHQPARPEQTETEMTAQVLKPGMDCEIAWFSALCDDDYEFLGVPDPYLKSSWEH